MPNTAKKNANIDVVSIFPESAKSSNLIPNFMTWLVFSS